MEKIVPVRGRRKKQISRSNATMSYIIVYMSLQHFPVTDYIMKQISKILEIHGVSKRPALS